MKEYKKIILVNLPFWDPLVPPQGIAALKYYLERYGYKVYTYDINVNLEFRKLYDMYFEFIKGIVPENKQGNFFNIGHDVLRNHLLAQINYTGKNEYVELTKSIIYNTFYWNFTDEETLGLIGILDSFYTKLETSLASLIEEIQPDVFGVSVMRDTIGPAIFSYRLVKKFSPEILTVVGGSIFSDHLCEGTPNFENFVEKVPEIDKIIIGEGQILFRKLLEGKLNSTQKVYTTKDIQGEKLGLNSELYEFDLSDFDVQTKYSYLSGQASASCPCQCSFCNVPVYFGKYTERPAPISARKMIDMYEKYKIQLFFMNDSLLNRVATPLSKAFLDEGTVVYWDGYLRVSNEASSLENTMLWRKGGMYRVRIGVESGSQNVLDLMHKGIQVEQTVQTLMGLANAGIKTTTYWVIGHPGETEEDFNQTLEFLSKYKDFIYEAECNPFIYGYSGQNATDAWASKREPLFPEKAKDMLILQSWKLNIYPSREETFKRVNRFVEQCKKLGIPNPYSVHNIYQADLRWKQLHQNSVPNLVEFKQNKYIDECRTITQSVVNTTNVGDLSDFNF